MTQENAKMDKTLVKIKAAEFDKVDVLKQNAELEGKNKNLAIDISNLTREKDL